jgi:F-type H+-transporting ATPase subunit b
LKYSNPHSSSCPRVSCFALLAVLAAGVAVAPFRLVAQESAPVANSAPVATPNETAKPEAAKSEEENNDVYRHTPIVASAAKALHLEVETTARLFEFINFAIIALAIGIPLVKILPKVIRKRSEKVSTDIESARKVTEDANTRLSAVEEKLSRLDEEIAKFRAEVEQESIADEARIKSSLNEESARIVSAAEQEIGVAAAQARRGLRNFAADLAIEQAGKQLVLSPETDRALIAEFVDDVNRKAVAKGGQN